MYEDIDTWLRAEAKRRKIHAQIHMKQGELKSGWLYIPVYIEEGDAYDKASRLQDLEDSWNDREPKPEPKVLLVPAAKS